MTDPQPKKSDLGVRVASALVMVAVAGTALWLGGWAWRVFVLAVALGVLWEWWGLVRGFVAGALGRTLWLVGGIAYIGVAAIMIALLRDDPIAGWTILLIVLFGVVGTDVGAYFAGRAIGGPKIAPKISPSKTWAGLGGGILGASAGIFLALAVAFSLPVRGFRNHELGEGFASSIEVVYGDLWVFLFAGAVVAIVAQSGDFFESWMKRRAGVKDSGKMIPGHGGLFDRADGIIAVLFAAGLLALVSYSLPDQPPSQVENVMYQ
jgi:phosphatidate cytidylyltransferase